MNRWPGDCSVLIMDNCAIHKTAALQRMVEGLGEKPRYLCYTDESLTLCYTGCRLVYLPPYSPDFNPIEESFSCCKLNYLVDVLIY